MGKKLINIMITLGLALIRTIQMGLCTHIHNETCSLGVETYSDNFSRN